MKTKIYKLQGLDYYVVNTFNELQACKECLKMHWGVTSKDLEEVSEVPNSAEKVIVAIWDKMVTGIEFKEKYLWTGTDFILKYE